MTGGTARQGSSTADAVVALLRAKQYDEATTKLSVALRTSPRDARLWSLKGIALSLSGRLDEASVAFERALALRPDDPAALRGEAQILVQKQDPRATMLLKRLVVNSPEDATAHEMLGTIEAQQGQCAEADAQFSAVGEQALAAHPELRAGLGRCLMASAQAVRAVPVFEELARQHPENTAIAYDLAVALVETKRTKEALTVLGPLVAKADDADALSLASEAAEAEGETPRAVSLERQAIVLQPAVPAYYVAFASLCLAHDSFQVGIDMLDAGIKNVPRAPSLYLARGLLLAQMAQYDRAEADFKQAELLDARQSISSYAMDIAELQRNHANPDASTLRAQVKAHPESPYLNYLLGKVLWSDGAGGTAVSAEALPYARRAAALKPDMAEARDLLASLYLATDRNDLAIAECRAALAADPGDQPAIYHLIVALRHSTDEAQRAEVPALVKRLSELKATARQEEIARKRFSLEEGPAPASPQ